MIDLKIKNDGEKVMAEYILKENDRIDNLTLGMLVNNDIKGNVPLTPVQVEDDRFFRYDITGMVTMRKYLGEYVKKDKMLKSFYGIALAIKEAMEYMINWTSFSLDLDDIYIDTETEKVNLVCMPLLTVTNDGNLSNFFKKTLFSVQYDMEEGSDYVGKLINLLNPKTYTLDNFIYELEEMLELEHSVVEEDEEIEETDESKENEEDAKVEEDAEDAEDTEIEEDVESAENAKVAGEDVANIDNDDKTETSGPIPFLIKVSNKQRIMIDKEVFYVGKNEAEVDYCIVGNSTIDEKHAYFIKHDKEYFVVDNNTKGRTYLNRVEIPSDEEVFIPHGAHVAFGTEEFEFKMHG